MDIKIPEIETWLENVSLRFPKLGIGLKCLPIVTLVICSHRLLRFIAKHSVNVMFFDEWDFLTPLFQGDPWYKMFMQQHGPHRQGLGGLVTYVVYQLSDWNARYQAFVAGVFFVLAAAIYLLFAYSLARKSVVWLCGIPILALTLRQFEYFLGAQNLSHGPVPAFLIAGIGLTLTAEALSTRLAVLLVTLAFCATFTGFAIFATPLVVVLSTISLFQCAGSKAQQWRWGCVGIGGISSLLYFFHGYAFIPAMPCFKFPAPNPLQYATFSIGLTGRSSGILTRAQDITGEMGWDWVMALSLYALEIAAVVFAGIRLLREKDLRLRAHYRAIAFLCGFSLGFQFFTAVGRVCGGIQGSWSSRYVAYSIPGIVGLMSAVYESQRGNSRSRRFTVLFLYLFTGLILQREYETSAREKEAVNFFHDGKLRWADCYMKTRNGSQCITDAAFLIHPDPKATNLSGKLLFLEQRHLSLFNAKGPSGRDDRPRLPP